MILTIGEKQIGDGKPTFVVAEAGINHNRDLKLAKKLIMESKNAGADAIKFQIYKTEEFCSQNSKYFDLFKSLEFKEKEWEALANFAKQADIIFTASVFGEASIDLLDRIGSPVFKIASSDLTYLQLLNYVAKKQKPIFLSTGMATIPEIQEAIDTISQTGNQQIVIFHCVSNYPTKYDETNLSVISSLKEIFHVPIGFSDHTVGTIIPIAAVALGANLIEKHFTLDRTLPGPDQSLSIEPRELQQIIEGIRIVEKSIGDGEKKPTSDEERTRLLARRSLIAKTDIEKGTLITKDMIKIVRPGTGIPPKHLSEIIGKKTKRTIRMNDIITWEDL